MIKCRINNTDVFANYGIYLGDESLVNLLLPPPNKAYLENKNANSNGKTTYINTNSPALVDERDVTLIFCIEATSRAQLLTRFAWLKSQLQAGAITLTTDLESGVTYHLNYISCTQLQSFFNRRAKIKVKFNEPNPNNRTA